MMGCCQGAALARAPPRVLAVEQAAEQAAAAAAAVANPEWGSACRPYYSSGGMWHVQGTLRQRLEALRPRTTVGCDVGFRN